MDSRESLTADQCHEKITQRWKFSSYFEENLQRHLDMEKKAK